MWTKSPGLRPVTCATIIVSIVGRDIVGHAQEDIAAALIELAGQLSLGHVELEQGVARRQRHVLDFGRVPRRDDVPAAVGFGEDRIDDVGDLIDGPPVQRRPRPPLLAVNRSKVAVLVGPFVPDRDTVLLQIGDIGVALQEPQQLVSDRFEMQLFRREQREARCQVEAHLVAKNRERTGAGAVGLFHTRAKNMVKQIKVLLHSPVIPLDPATR